METQILKMKCINNYDYEECMTIGKVYDVRIEYLDESTSIKKFLDDDNQPLKTILDKFELA